MKSLFHEMTMWKNFLTEAQAAKEAKRKLKLLKESSRQVHGQRGKASTGLSGVQGIEILTMETMGICCSDLRKRKTRHAEEEGDRVVVVLLLANW